MEKNRSANSKINHNKRVPLKKIPMGMSLKVSPPWLEEFDNLGKRTTDILIDVLKYYAVTSGIAISFYSSQFLKDLNQQKLSPDQFSRLVLFLPLLLWLFVILVSVIAIYPRLYKANTDLDKKQVIIKIRNSKRFWSIVATYLFILGFVVFLYILAAQLWVLYPFT